MFDTNYLFWTCINTSVTELYQSTSHKHVQTCLRDLQPSHGVMKLFMLNSTERGISNGHTVYMPKITIFML